MDNVPIGCINSDANNRCNHAVNDENICEHAHRVYRGDEDRHYKKFPQESPRKKMKMKVDKCCIPNPCYSKEPSRFLFPPAYLTMPDANNNGRHAINPIFESYPNGNMIIFEILIKIIDFVHDNIKDTTRIVNVDKDFWARKINLQQSGGSSNDKSSSNLVEPSVSSEEQYTNTEPLTNLDEPSVSSEEMYDISEQNETMNNVGFIFTEIISYMDPFLIEKISNFFFSEENKENIENNNEILLLCFIIVTNNLFTTKTNYNTDEYLTSFTFNIYTDNDGNINLSDLNLNEEILTEKNKYIKIIKFTIIQTILENFYGIKNSFKYKENNNFFEILSEENNFFMSFFENLSNNRILLNLNNNNFEPNEEKTYSGGASPQQIRNFLVSQSKSTVIINNQILRLFVCKILEYLSIIRPTDSVYFEYTDFGNAIMTDENSNMTNYDRTVQFQTLLPLNDSPPHPTLNMLRHILTILEQIWQQNIVQPPSQKNFFRNFTKFEHSLTSGLIAYFEQNNKTFKVPLPTTQVQNDEDCCPYAHIIDNAATTLSNSGRGSELSEYKISHITTLLDAAGSSNIVKNGKHELGEMNFVVAGLNTTNRIDPNVHFRGIVNIKTKIISNNSKNYIFKRNGNDDNITVNYTVALNFNREINSDHLDIQKTPLPSRRINALLPNSSPINPQLKHVRHHFLEELLDYFEIAPVTDDLFSPLYENILRSKNFLQQFLGRLGNKTVGDLMQVLTAMVKFGGITNIVAFGAKVIPFNENGHAIRHLSQHDLTSSAIASFLKLFGGWRWETNTIVNNIQGWVTTDYNNCGMNDGSFLSDHTTCNDALGDFHIVRDTFRRFKATIRDRDNRPKQCSFDLHFRNIRIDEEFPTNNVYFKPVKGRLIITEGDGDDDDDDGGNDDNDGGNGFNDEFLEKNLLFLPEQDNRSSSRIKALSSLPPSLSSLPPLSQTSVPSQFKRMTVDFDSDFGKFLTQPNSESSIVVSNTDPKVRHILNELSQIFGCNARGGSARRPAILKYLKQIEKLNITELTQLYKLLTIYSKQTDRTEYNETERQICEELEKLLTIFNGGSKIKTLRRNKKRHNTRNKNSILNGTKKHYRKKYKTKKSYFL
jgi:hypothetical protein